MRRRFEIFVKLLKKSEYDHTKLSIIINIRIKSRLVTTKENSSEKST